MAMNVIRLAADFIHLISIALLLLKIRASKSCAGISLKTQQLLFIVCVTRYLDLVFAMYHGLYLAAMKVLFIGLTGTTVHMMMRQTPYKQTYDPAQDQYLHWKFAVLPCAIITLIITVYSYFFARHPHIGILSEFWTFSILLESIAILPQLVTLQHYREVENLTGNYIFFMGTYRALYIANWVYRYFMEPGYQHHVLVYICGVVQTILYSDFLYVYIKAKYRGEKISLPT